MIVWKWFTVSLVAEEALAAFQSHSKSGFFFQGEGGAFLTFKRAAGNENWWNPIGRAESFLAILSGPKSLYLGAVQLCVIAGSASNDDFGRGKSTH